MGSVHDDNLWYGQLAREREAHAEKIQQVFKQALADEQQAAARHDTKARLRFRNVLEALQAAYPREAQ